MNNVRLLPARPRGTHEARRFALIRRGLEAEFPVAPVALTWRTPLDLLVATMLSAQCTDDRVNQVTASLFARYRTARDYAEANPATLERAIQSVGLYRRKARAITEACRRLVKEYGGAVPDTMETLTTLPGVGRKTANVILGQCFGRPAIVVDTHVRRVTRRLGLTDSDNPDRIEADLARMFPRRQWTRFSHQMLLHGRHICMARVPHCGRCRLYDACRWEGKRPRGNVRGNGGGL